MRGITPARPLITCNDAAQWRMASLLMRALAHCVLLVAKTLFGA
jgi:hypothetical protein